MNVNLILRHFFDAQTRAKNPSAHLVCASKKGATLLQSHLVRPIQQDHSRKIPSPRSICPRHSGGREPECAWEFKG